MLPMLRTGLFPFPSGFQAQMRLRAERQEKGTATKKINIKKQMNCRKAENKGGQEYGR